MEWLLSQLTTYVYAKLAGILLLCGLGLPIPEDISLIGFDDLPFCEITSPKLTTIRTVKKELGQMAVEKIIDMVKNGDHIKTKIEFSTTFIERDSVKELVH